ncbi:2-oxo-tetronate isomerase [Phaeacidiphilus oryzae]|uniref:2-oxo-tetronate isomerase n=1 Tax=Phaeacidiphilus oryzae TaxID=348818 RepID=UPI00056850BD|nr:2-oxo-tetronate isomerase [Phaeacidiphilus oryzae]
MPRFAANLSLMYTEHEFPDRFTAAAAHGFRAVEYLFPYPWPAAELRRRLDDNGLRQVLFNAPPGDWAAGERGTAALPGREAETRAGTDRALEYAAELGCDQVHMMAGLVPDARREPGARIDRTGPAYATYLENLAWAAERAAAAGVRILIEPINPRDMPGYLLNHQADAHAVLEAVGAENLKVQLDLYHCQIVEGDLTTTLRRDLPTGRVAHIQIAGVPDRHEPHTGELNLRHLLDVIDQQGYRGWIGCEYHPRAGTGEGLHWIGDHGGASA